MWPPGLLDESVHLTEAKPGPLTQFLGGEERFEGTTDHIGSHADTRIRHANNHVLARWQLRIHPAVVLVYVNVCALKRQLSAIWHGIARIDGEVDKRRLQMICVDFHPPQPGRTNSLNLDFFAQGTLKKFGGAAEEFVDVGWLWIEWLPAGKGKQTACQRRCALSASHRISECAAERSVDRRLNRLMLSRFQIADHDHKEVVEIVCDASAQLANCLHLLRDGKLVLSSLKLLLSFTSFGDVSGYFRKADKLT
jgi:hypothetical protein